MSEPTVRRALDLSRLFTARSYVLVVRPVLLATAVALMAVNEVADSATVDRSIWLTLAGFTVVQLVVVAVAVLDRLRAAVVLTFIGDAVLVSAGVLWAPEPIGASSLMTFFVVATAFYASARVTVAMAVGFAAEITVISHSSTGWDGSLVFPNTAFVVLATGALTATLVARIRRTERELQVSLDEQLEARRDLERVARVRDRLIANVSHELRTPLTATLGSIETILRDDITLDRAARTELLGLARNGGHRLLSLVEDLLTLGVTRPDTVRPHPEPAELAPLVREAVHGIDPGERRSIRLDLDDGARAVVDPRRIEQVVGNLVSNAVEHGAGEVVVQLERDPEGTGIAVVRVTDEGPGVAPEHLDELFLPFARFSDRPDSTGLGLAISRAIVEAHGGTLTYGRAAGRTSFTMNLPAELAPTS